MSQARQFNDSYKKNTNWMDDPKIDVAEFLRTSFPQYYDKQGSPNYLSIKQGIINNEPKAKELFKALFKLPFKLTAQYSDLFNCPSLAEIQKISGNSIIAHGVEEAKGGMYNILMMCVSNLVRVNSYNWGNFVNGHPSISPIAHGPYYIIFTTNAQAKPHAPSNPKLEDVEFILVPFKQNIEILSTYLAKLVKHEMLTQEQMLKFAGKLIDFNAFLIIQQNRSKILVSKSNKENIPDNEPSAKRTKLCPQKQTQEQAPTPPSPLKQAPTATATTQTQRLFRRVNLNTEPQGTDLSLRRKLF